MTTGGERFLKIVLIIFNGIFAIGGLISLVCGAVALGEVNSGKSGLAVNESDHTIAGAAGLLIAIGCFIFITAILGCIATFREHRIALLVYSVILVLILILQFAAAVTAFVLKNKLEDVVRDALQTIERSIHNDTTTELDPYGKTFQTFQSNWRCCGIDAPQDWDLLPWFHTKYADYAKKAAVNVTFPGCCFDPVNCHPCTDKVNTTTPDCVATKVKESIYAEGCVQGLADYLKKNAGIVAGVAVSFGIIQIVGIILACCLARHLGDSGNHERIG